MSRKPTHIYTVNCISSPSLGRPVTLREFQPRPGTKKRTTFPTNLRGTEQSYDWSVILVPRLPTVVSTRWKSIQLTATFNVSPRTYSWTRMTPNVFSETIFVYFSVQNSGVYAGGYQYNDRGLYECLIGGLATHVWAWSFELTLAGQVIACVVIC